MQIHLFPSRKILKFLKCSRVDSRRYKLLSFIVQKQLKRAIRIFVFGENLDKNETKTSFRGLLIGKRRRVIITTTEKIRQFKFISL